MILHRKIVLLIGFLLYAYSLLAKDHILTLGNPEGKYLSMDLLGGAFIDFRLSKQSDNPYSWYLPTNEMPENNRQGARFQGHFMCLGRWGASYNGEMKALFLIMAEAGNKLRKFNFIERRFSIDYPFQCIFGWNKGRAESSI